MNKNTKTIKNRNRVRSTWISVGILTVIATAVLALTLFRNEENTQASFSPISSFRDIHGLAIDPNDPEILYVATHHGLVRGINDEQWATVGNYRADFMGFSLHPNGKVFYSSGHPPTGGNIGVAMSTDKGQQWKTIALAGQVDFHSMAISPANPQVLFGWHGNRLFKSVDGGQQWNNPGGQNLPQVFSFAPDPLDERVVWSATAQGLYVSRDGGNGFAPVAFNNEVTTAVSVEPKTSTRIYVWVVGQGLLKSDDSGNSWQSLGAGIEVAAQDAVGHLAIDPTNPQRMYAATFSAAIYKSLDGGNTWKLVKRG